MLIVDDGLLFEGLQAIGSEPPLWERVGQFYARWFVSTIKVLLFDASVQCGGGDRHDCL